MCKADKCSQSANERDALIAEAEKEGFSSRRLEFVGNDDISDVTPGLKAGLTSQQMTKPNPLINSFNAELNDSIDVPSLPHKV
jgi:hypothetical protein